MSGRENSFKKYLLKKMGTVWDVQSHEDRYSEGIPDLSYGSRKVNGWIELKQVKKIPSLPSSIVKPDKYTSIQVNWLSRRGKSGGHCFILIKVGKDMYFLFNYTEAKMIKSGLTLQQYYLFCIEHWKSSIIPKELISFLTDPVFS